MNTPMSLLVSLPTPLQSQCLKLDVLLNLSESSHVPSAQIDSRAACNFLDNEVVQMFRIPTQGLLQPVSTEAIDGGIFGEGFGSTHTQSLELQVNTLHRETISFFVTRTQNQNSKF